MTHSLYRGAVIAGDAALGYAYYVHRNDIGRPYDPDYLYPYGRARY